LIDENDGNVEVLCNLFQVVHVLVQLLLAFGQFTTARVIRTEQGSDGVDDLQDTFVNFEIRAV
jgi:hypothetical protein